MVSRYDPAQTENAVGGKFGFQRKQHKRSDDQSKRRITRGQQIEREERQQDEHHADDSGHDRAGMIELGVEGQRANRKHDEGDIGIEQEVEYSLPQGHG